MPYYIWAWIGSISSGLVAVLGKLTSKYAITNALLVNFLWLSFVALLIFPISLVNSARLPIYWNHLIITALGNTLFFMLYTLAIYRLDVSVIVPLYSLRIPVTAVLSMLLIGEVLSPSQYILIVVIFIGGVFVSIDERLTIRSLLT